MNAATPAAGPWIAMTKRLPKPGATYLIRTEIVGPCYDCAFYHGRRKDGSHWWVLGNIEIDARSITHWAHLVDPEELRSPEDFRG